MNHVCGQYEYDAETGAASMVLQTETGVEEIALWTVLGVTALVGTLVAGSAAYDRMHRRRAHALGKRKKPKIQL